MLYFSSSGTTAVDPTAIHQLTDVNLRLGDSNADISMSPDGTTLLIADNQVNRAFLLNTNTGRSQLAIKINIVYKLKLITVLV